jgi:hypothetical protein
VPHPYSDEVRWLGLQIVVVSLAVRRHLAAHTSVKAIRFLTNYLLPPPKRAVLAHLGIPLATGETVKKEDHVPIVRKAEVDVSRGSYINIFYGFAGIVCYIIYMYGTHKAGFGSTY